MSRAAWAAVGLGSAGAVALLIGWALSRPKLSMTLNGQSGSLVLPNTSVARIVPAVSGGVPGHHLTIYVGCSANPNPSNGGSILATGLFQSDGNALIATRATTLQVLGAVVDPNLHVQALDDQGNSSGDFRLSLTGSGTGLCSQSPLAVGFGAPARAAAPCVGCSYDGLSAYPPGPYNDLLAQPWPTSTGPRSRAALTGDLLLDAMSERSYAILGGPGLEDDERENPADQ